VCEQRPEALRRSIGYVIQEGGLFPHRNVAANVATVPSLLGWPRDRIRRRVLEVLSLVGLPEEEFGRRLPAELSGGQRQRVGVARGLAADPDLLLMDEPFSALDPGTRSTLQDEFLRLQAKLRKTIVLVTHDLAEAAKLADAIVLLAKGRLVQEGTLADLLLRPADERVSAFVGDQGRELALETLRLQHVLADLPSPIPEADGKPARTLSPELRLGQVLVALAELPDQAQVVVASETRLAYQAAILRRAVLQIFRAASPDGAERE
jgi:osmoprotectant transport system ATP-binding protein